MDERQVRVRIQSCVYDYADHLDWQPGPGQDETPVVKLESYGQRRIITEAEGFILTLSDGSEYQVTVTQSKIGANEK